MSYVPGFSEKQNIPFESVEVETAFSDKSVSLALILLEATYMQMNCFHILKAYYTTYMISTLIFIQNSCEVP